MFKTEFYADCGFKLTVKPCIITLTTIMPNMETLMKKMIIIAAVGFMALVNAAKAHDDMFLLPVVSSSQGEEFNRDGSITYSISKTFEGSLIPKKVMVEPPPPPEGYVMVRTEAGTDEGSVTYVLRTTDHAVARKHAWKIPEIPIFALDAPCDSSDEKTEKECLEKRKKAKEQYEKEHNPDYVIRRVVADKEKRKVDRPRIDGYEDYEIERIWYNDGRVDIVRQTVYSDADIKQRREKETQKRMEKLIGQVENKLRELVRIYLDEKYSPPNAEQLRYIIPDSNYNNSFSIYKKIGPLYNEWRDPMPSSHRVTVSPVSDGIQITVSETFSPEVSTVVKERREKFDAAIKNTQAGSRSSVPEKKEKVLKPEETVPFKKPRMPRPKPTPVDEYGNALPSLNSSEKEKLRQSEKP